MKKQFTFSIDTSKGYFWIILILIGFVLFQYFSTGDVSKLELQNSELKGKNEILVSNERKSNDYILALKDSLNSIRSDKTALQLKLDSQKTNYKTIIIEKDAKKNTIDSYDNDELSSFLPKRYHKD